MIQSTSESRLEWISPTARSYRHNAEWVRRLILSGTMIGGHW
jgi:hypothetical protein